MTENEYIIKVNGVDICTKTFGNPSDPAILLIMGASASMIWWNSEFCNKIAAGGRFVIRFDNRDVGRSVSYGLGKLQYDVIDMVNDAVGVLDYYRIEKAHFAGMSLGGMISQLAAIIYPQKVLSLTLISTSVWDDIPTLPPIEPKVLEYHSTSAIVDWSSRDSVINYMVEGWRLLNGTSHPFDYEQALNLAKTEYDRANDLPSMFNHAMLKGGERFYGRSTGISVPTLIIHGTEDPVLPFEHAIELNRTIKNSVLVSLEGSGHEIHIREWENVIRHLLNHTK